MEIIMIILTMTIAYWYCKDIWGGVVRINKDINQIAH